LGKSIMPANRVESVSPGRRWKKDRRRHYLNCQKINFAQRVLLNEPERFVNWYF
jgi:hypothetical protein